MLQTSTAYTPLRSIWIDGVLYHPLEGLGVFGFCEREGVEGATYAGNVGNGTTEP
jgi:hypothetical protein